MSFEELRRLLGASHDAWLRGDSHHTWRSLEQAEALAGEDAAARAEVAGARSVALLRAERVPESLRAARQCLALAAAVPEPDAPLRRAIAHARVTLASNDPSDDSDPQAFETALRVLDEIAEEPDPDLVEARSRAITNALVRRLGQVWDRLGDGRTDAQAWIWVSRARVLSEGLTYQGTVARQAVDLAFRTGQWERGWDYVHQPMSRHTERNEYVAMSAKAALLAWERGMDQHARHRGMQACQATTAVDHPWVRTYGYLGAVIAAAAGAGSVAGALRAYGRCTTGEGHRSRPNRAWLAARVALEAGAPPGEVRAFLDRVLPEGMPRSLSALARIVLGHAEGHVPDERDLEEAVVGGLDASDQGRVLLAAARGRAASGQRVAALLELQRARQILRAWPGRVLDRVEHEAGGSAGSLPMTSAQRRVLDLLVEGWSNRQIAGQLACSERTVAVHVAALLRAEGVSSRTALAVRELARRVLADRAGRR